LLFIRILVGAPLDQNLQPGTNHSGALWKCTLTSYHNDCQQVVTDGKRSKLIVLLILESDHLKWLTNLYLMFIIVSMFFLITYY